MPPRLYIFAASPARDACRIGQASDSLRGTRARLAANDMHGFAGVAKGSCDDPNAVQTKLYCCAAATRERENAARFGT
jgi:hypothetical protein